MQDAEMQTEKVFNEQVKAFDLKLSNAMPAEVMSEIYGTMNAMMDFSRNIAQHINNNLFEEREVRRETTDTDGNVKPPLVKSLWDCNKQEIRNFLAWYGMWDEEYNTLCKRLFGHTLGPTNKNSHILNRTVENVGGLYQAAIKRIKKMGSIQSESNTVEERYTEKLFELMDTLKEGTTLRDAIMKRCASKRKSDLQTPWASILEFYGDMESKCAEGKITYNLATLYSDHIIREAARLKYMMLPCMDKETFIREQVPTTKKHKTECLLKSFDSPAVEEEMKHIALQKTVEAYIKEKVRYKFADSLLYQIEHTNDEFKKHNLSLIYGYYTNNTEKVHEEFRKYIKGIVRKLQEKGGVNITIPELAINVDDKRPCIHRVSAVKQFADLGMEKVYGCKHLLRVKWLTDDNGKPYGHEMFSHCMDRKTGTCFSLVDTKGKGYIYIPIYISDRDERSFDIDSPMGMEVTLKQRETKKHGTQLFAFFTTRYEEHKPVNRFSEATTAGTDINSKHCLCSCSEMPILECDAYVDIPQYVYEFYTERGDNNRVKGLSQMLNLGKEQGMEGRHPTFGLIDSIICTDVEGKYSENRFSKRADGSYTVKRDIFVDALKELQKTVKGDIRKVNYVAACRALRNHLAQLHAVKLEFKDKLSAYTTEHGKEYSEEHPFADTMDGQRLVKAQQKLKGVVARNEQEIVAYVCYVLQQCGYKANVLEYITRGTWTKCLDMLTPRKFVDGCNYEANAFDIPVNETNIFKRSCRFFNYNLSDFTYRDNKVALNEVGIAHNNKVFMINQINKYLGLGSLKQVFSLVARKYDIQTHFVQPALTSQVDNLTGFVPELKGDVRPTQEMFIHQDGSVSNADFVGACNIKDCIVNPIKRTRLHKENSDFADYGATQFIPIDKGIKYVREVYGEVYNTKLECEK